jgi:hypothetical protein
MKMQIIHRAFILSPPLPLKLVEFGRGEKRQADD